MRFAVTFACACLLIALPAAAQEGGPEGTVINAMDVSTPEEAPGLADLLWIARPIVLFADTPNDPRFIQQMQMLEQQARDLEDRSVVVLTDTDPAAAGPLRRELRPRGFGLVLIDTDGSIVQRRPAPTTAREIINLIDRLPSRRQETGSRRQ